MLDGAAALRSAFPADPSIRRRLLVVSDAAPHRNGVGAYYQDLLPSLKPRLEAVDIVSPEIVDGQWRGGLTLPLPGDATQKFCVPNLVSLKRRIDDFEPDVVIVPTPGPFGLLGAYYATRRGARVLVGFHTWYEKLTELYWSRVPGLVTRGFFVLSNRLLFRWADTVLANSAAMVDIARCMGASSATLMGTPVSGEFLKAPTGSLPTSVGKVLFAGRLSAEKNINAVLAAARELPAVQFSIAGSGPLQNGVIQAAAALPNLDYLGWLSREKLMRAMDNHDVLVLPSHVESFGTIALEGMARQRLVVVSEHCGIVDWPDLTAHLNVVRGGASLSAVLRQMRLRDARDLAAQASAARGAVEHHVAWNIDSWVNIIVP